MTPLITIGIPIYNVENYIEEALLSALNQSYPNIEILLVDDKGNDCSMQLVKRIIQNHPRKKYIKILRHQKNEGLSCARNTIIKNAKGEFLYFMDSDDYITNDCIQLLYSTMESNPVDFVEASYCTINKNKLQIISSHQHTDYLIQDDISIYNHLYKNNILKNNEITYTAWNKLFNLQFLKEKHINFIPHIYYEDRPFTLLIYLKGTSCRLISNITYYYRKRTDSIMHIGIEKYTEKEIKDYIFQIEWKKNIAFEYKKEPFAELIIQETMIEAIFSAFYYLKKEQYIEINGIRPFIRQLVSYPYTIPDIKYFNKYKYEHLKYWMFSKLPYWLQKSYLKKMK